MLSIFKRKNYDITFNFFYHSSLTVIKNNWDEILPANHHLKSDYLEFLEKYTNIDGHYITVYQKNDLVGIVYFQKLLVGIENIGFSFESIKKFNCIQNSLKNSKCGLEFLVCGNIYRPNQEGYFLMDGVSKEEIFSSLIEDLAKNIDFSGILLKECPVPLQHEGKFMLIKQDVSMEMAIDTHWKTIDDYLGVLDKKYRKRFLKIQKTGIEIEKRVLTLDDLHFYQSKMFELYTQVYDKQDFKLTDIAADYFIGLKNVLGDKLKVFGFFKNDELIAFTSHIYNVSNQMEIHYIGFNYELNKQYNLYFNILQFGLECAILDSQKTLELGRTSNVAKSSLGAKPSLNYNYVYFKKHIYNWSFKWFIKKIYKNIESEWQTRSPFVAGVEI